MQDKIIARRHNVYRLKSGLVKDLDPGKGPLMQAGIGPATMENITVDWDEGEDGKLVRRFPVEVQKGHRLYALMVESGVSAHPDRPVFLFNAGNGHQHREINAPAIRSRIQLVAGRLPILLAAIVAAAFLSIYIGYSGQLYRDLAFGLAIAVGALILSWAGLMIHDVRQNRNRAERLEDEHSAAKEAVEAMNQDIASRIAQRSAPEKVVNQNATEQDAGS